MPRIPGSGSVASVIKPTRREALPQRTASTASAWGAAPMRTVKKALLASLDGTLADASWRHGGKLKFPSSIAGVPVKSATEIKYALMLRGADVQFGKLTPPQFDALKAEFGGRSQVRFDAQRNYSATDFLPPALQGLVGKDLDTGQPVEIPGTSSLAEEMLLSGNVSIGATPNGHGTAWEAARAYQGQTGSHVQLAYGDASTAQTAYERDFKKVSTLKPGDVVTFSNETQLLHSAVYAGGGLFFEKPDTEIDDGNESAYRLATYEQVTAPIHDAMGADLIVNHLSPKANLPAPSQAFTASEYATKLESILQKRGETTGRPLVMEVHLGIGGGTQGMTMNAVVTKRVETNTLGLGVLR